MSKDGGSNKRQKVTLGLLCDSTFDKNTISFAKHLKGNIRYFELPDIKAATDINNWSLIGSDQEDAVVCSNDVTYSIKKVEMSSDAYILPPSSDSKFEVSGSANSYYELRPITGRLDKIGKLLDGAEYPIPCLKNPVFYSKEELRNQVQASENEINEYCLNNDIICYDNKMRKLDRESLWGVLRSLLDTCLELDLNVEAMNEKDLIEKHMVGVDVVLLEHVLKDLSSQSRQEGAKIWKLDPVAIYKASAHILFREYYRNKEYKKPWPMRDFFLTWESRVPNCGSAVPFAPSLNLLKGIAITATIQNAGERESDVNHGLIYAPSESLSSNPKQRLHQLYTCRKTKSSLLCSNSSTVNNTPAQFTFAELEGYFTDMVGGTGQPKSVVELLLLHATLLDGVYHEK